MQRVILIVLDSVGVGALPDAEAFGDARTNTLGNIAAQTPDFRLPNLEAMGLGNLAEVHLPPASAPTAAFGKAAEKSPGKDTITGHWEISGIVPDISFPYYPQGFPPAILDPFEAQIGTKTLGNYPASGTVVIEELGAEHMRTGFPIVYTSSDSVFQIAMHEDIIPIDRQYEICKIAREILVGENAIGRVIARPFVGTPGNFTRTANRKDYSLSPPSRTILDAIQDAGKEVRGVGKISDIFNGVGISENTKTKHNMDGVDKTLAYMEQDFEGLIFTNLVDFDMLYGHRRNVPGYAQCLRDFDARLPEIQAAMRPSDVLILTADHGNDPTHTGTDHTREYVPILVYGKAVQAGVDLGIRASFADMGATVGEMLGTKATEDGESFWAKLTNPELEMNGK
ncbi:MAG: phosphopentomutase [Bacteroidota bacterium]